MRARGRPSFKTGRRSGSPRTRSNGSGSSTPLRLLLVYAVGMALYDHIHWQRDRLMSAQTIEILKIVGSFAGAILSGLAAFLIKEWFDRRRERRREHQTRRLRWSRKVGRGVHPHLPYAQNRRRRKSRPTRHAVQAGSREHDGNRRGSSRAVGLRVLERQLVHLFRQRQARR